MIPVPIEGAHGKAMKPDGWNDDEAGPCGTLPYRIDNIGGYGFLVSAWDVEQMEAIKLLAGAKIHLGISATQHPVTNMRLGPLPDEFPPVYTVVHIVAEQPTIRVVRLDPKGSIYADALLGDTGIGNAFARAVMAIEQFAENANKS